MSGKENGHQINSQSEKTQKGYTRLSASFYQYSLTSHFICRRFRAPTHGPSDTLQPLTPSMHSSLQPGIGAGLEWAFPREGIPRSGLAHHPGCQRGAHRCRPHGSQVGPLFSSGPPGALLLYLRQTQDRRGGEDPTGAPKEGTARTEPGVQAGLQRTPTEPSTLSTNR